MIDNVLPEISRAAPEKQANTVRLLFRPDVAKKNIGKYFIDEEINGIIRDKKIVEEFLDSRDLEATQQKKVASKKIDRKSNADGTLKRSKYKDLFDEQDNSEIKFVNLVREYHEKLSNTIEKKGQLLKDHKDEFLDSLSIGILYGIYKDRIQELKSSDLPVLIESDQFKTAKKTVLLALAEESLSRMDGPDLKEINTYQRFLKRKNLPEQDLSGHKLKNYFTKSLEDNPEEFLQDYYINFRFYEDTDALKNSRNVFKLGEIVASKSAEVNKQAIPKVRDVKEFLPYEDKEHGFLGKRFWGEKMDAGLEIQTVKENLSNALHKKDGAQHRSEKSLVDKGILKVHPEGGFTAEAEFFDVFSEYYQNEEGKPNTENQMVFGMLYSMRKELGVGILSQTEVLRQAKEIAPGLQRAGNDLLTTFLRNNLDEFYPELIDLFKENAKAGLLSKNILKELNEIKQEDGKNDYKQEVFTVISRNRGEITKLLVNNRHINGFEIGEIFGKVLKDTSLEKKSYDNKNIDKLNLQTDDENAVMGLLIEGKKITDPGIRDRVEATMKKTSRLWRWTQRTATKTKIAIQDKLFYSEGESPWLAKPSLATETKSATVGAAAAISFGHMVNYIMEDPVNRGVQAGLFVAGYFVTKEGGAYIREINARKKELGLERPKQRGKAFSVERKRYRGEYKKELKAYKEQMKLIKREVGKRFWHNKVKMLYSSGSYLLTSIGANYLLQIAGLSGSEAPMVLAATNVAVSGLLSAGGMRSGAEFIVNSLGSKKAVDGGMELLTGNKKSVRVERDQPVKKPTLFNKMGEAFATNIAPNIVKVGRKIKYVNEVMTRHEEESRHLKVLEKFVERKNHPDDKFSKAELVEAVKFLTLMKEEEGMLLIHNSRFYEKRMIRQPDGSFIEIDNRKGLENIDSTRKEIVEYAQNNLPKEDYDEVVESSLNFYADVKNIREKVFHKRMKYLVASYGYRVTFMIMSHSLQSQGGLLEQPMNKIFGNATMDYQHVIEQDPTTVFNADVKTPKGQEALAKEVWARAEEINNLVNLMGTSEQLSEFQPGVESHLAYYGVNQQQIELLVDNLKKNNLNTSDLMRVIYVLSSYKEGQEYLSEMRGFEGTERRNLAPLIAHISQDPVKFMKDAVADKENAILIALKYPDLAQKLGINSEPLADQLKPLVMPESAKDQILAGIPAENPIVITKIGPQVISVGNVAAEFVDGLSKGDRQSRIDFLTQMNEVYRADSSLLQQAVNFHYTSFLADSNYYINIEDHPILNTRAIEHLPGESMIYKIYHAINPQTDAEIFRVTDLLNKAKSGDVNSYNQLCQLVAGADQANLNKIFDSQVDASIYDKVLNNLPGEEVLRKEEIVRRLQQEMIGMGLRPVGAPIMDLTEMTDLSKDPAIFVDPREALIRALSLDNSDLEMAVSLTGNTRTLFVQNDQVVGDFKTDLQTSISYSPEDLAILKAIEGAESDNNRLAFPKIIGKNLAYVFKLRPTASGATPPAGSLIEMMTGPFGHGAMNPEAPSALHNYDAYGPGYLSKLIIAHFRGRVPEELLTQMGPDADLTKSIGDKDPSIIDRLSNKFETLIAEKVLVAKYGEDKVGSVYLNHVTLGVADGIELKGVEETSQVLFAKPFSELTLGEKFLIEALGQSPGEYLYDNKFGPDGITVIESVPNPAKAINHALNIIEQGKIGDKLDKYLPGGKEQILADLHAMDKQVKDEGWDKVFNMHLPAGVDNFSATPDAARFTGMTDDQIAKAIKNGEIKGVTFTNNGIRVIELNNITIEETSRAIPENLMVPYPLTGEQNIEGQLATQYSAMFTDAKLDNNFYTTVDGIQVPAWWTVFKDVKTGQMVENVVPGMAIVEISSDGAVAIVDPTNTLSSGPQLFGSAFKPLVVFSVLKLHPELNLGEQQFNAVSTNYQGQLIANSAQIVDNQGTLDLRHALAASANVPMVDMWTKLSVQDPNLWHEFQQLAKDQFGIHFYELKEGKYTEVTSDPFVGNAALPVGNIFVGGATPEASGMMQMAEFYQELGEMSVKGDPAAFYVTDALGNDKYKEEVDIFGPELRKYFDGVIAKTGSQQGFDLITGEPMAIRNIVAMVKTGQDGKVNATLIVTGGIKPDGNATELGWGSEFLKTAKEITESTNVTTSVNSAWFALNQAMTTPEISQNYQLGAISVDQFYPFIKSLSSEDQYAYLREAIRTGHAKYLFVDLVGAPINGEVQPVAIHFIDKDGVNKLFTLNVPANIIEPAGPLINHFSDTSSQTTIVDLLTKAAKLEPEKYGDLLTQYQSQGINFVPLHNYEVSPALFAIHEQMEKTGMLFTGGEDNGAVMEQLGLDPKTTVFVNDELFRALNQENPNVIKEQLFVQREYLAMAAIYESSGLPGALDTLIYDKDMTSNPSYQLLKIFVETKTSQIFKPVDSERQFLINQFQSLISDPEKAKALAPDVITAYNLYNEMSSGIARGVIPTQVQSQAFIDAINNFSTTTNERTLLSLGIGINSTAQNSTSLPPAIVNAMSEVQPVIAGVSLEAVQSSAQTVTDLVNNFIKHPEKFDFMNTQEKATASLVTNNANLILEIVEASEAKNLQGQELINYINNNLPDDIKNDSVLKGYIELFSNNGRQCGAMNLIINRILVLEDPEHFSDMGAFPPGTVKGWITDLIQANREDKNVVSIVDGVFIKKIVDDVTDLNPGDTLVATAPWMGDDDIGDVTKVVMKGVENGKPYVLVFGSNFNVDGKTQFRKIFDLNELIRNEDWKTRDRIFTNPTISPTPPIFGSISVAEPANIINP